jgi:hypothetical protein
MSEYIRGEGICIHKNGKPWKTQVGWCCDVCGCIRFRHSTLELVPIAHVGGITVLTSVTVPIQC